MPSVNFIPFEYYTGLENMAKDESLLNDLVEGVSNQPTFRLYGWKPACVSLGRNQKEDFLDKEFLKECNIDVVTRLTGGRALLHDQEVTYSFVCPQNLLENGASVMGSYKEISKILINAFAQLGIELSLGGDSVHTKHDYCMLVSTGADLNYQGKKLVGSAQCRKKGYILQHGSILYDYDKELLEQIFKEPVDTTQVTTIKEILNCSIEDFCKDFQSALTRSLSELF